MGRSSGREWETSLKMQCIPSSRQLRRYKRQNWIANSLRKLWFSSPEAAPLFSSKLYLKLSIPRASTSLSNAFNTQVVPTRLHQKCGDWWLHSNSLRLAAFCRSSEGQWGLRDAFGESHRQSLRQLRINPWKCWITARNRVLRTSQNQERAAIARKWHFRPIYEVMRGAASAERARQQKRPQNSQLWPQLKLSLPSSICVDK